MALDRIVVEFEVSVVFELDHCGLHMTREELVWQERVWFFDGIITHHLGTVFTPVCRVSLSWISLDQFQIVAYSLCLTSCLLRDCAS